MKLRQPKAEIFVPDGRSVDSALARTTHMAFGAHADDIEIMAYHGILECFGRSDRWFTAVVATNGAGSPRSGLYAGCTDEAMREVRKAEQKKAGVVGEYSAVVLLDYPSARVKNPPASEAVGEFRDLIAAARPSVIYTHNLADKHDTHVATAMRVIEACRELPPEDRPGQLLGGEVWRDLDWMADRDKVPLDVGQHENLAAALLGLFDSQIAGGKRYDLATMGRRRAHATYHESHGVDVSTALTFAMDLTPLITDTSKDIAAYAQALIDGFAQDVRERIRTAG
jgi:LmbE family N-acetylglucosaminyl deacetylase